MRTAIPGFILVSFTLLISSGMLAQTSANHFSASRVVKMDYLLYLPSAYNIDKQAKFPLVLFLHGSGESGSDLNLVNKNGLPKLISEGKEFPFVVVSPQCPASESSWDSRILKLLLEDIIANYRIDTNRLYLTGLSIGGWGTWDMAFRYPGLFAAIAPVCGFFDYILSDEFRSTPVWIFHGAKDDVVPADRAISMFEAVRKQGGEVKITIYPEANHDSWTETYNNPELYRWFLQHSKNGVAAEKK
ncbi:MAG: prolyl oligopeptidase family serine peptidase [Bacteroidetes bacterium]|nr:prolyl oligopeptidase family serine peptidase [Bacteroidota bacterium]